MDPLRHAADPRLQGRTQAASFLMAEHVDLKAKAEQKMPEAHRLPNRNTGTD